MPDSEINTGLRVYTRVAVAALPLATAVPVGTRYFVSDSDIGMQNGIGKTAVAGGGGFSATVRSTGTTWKIT